MKRTQVEYAGDIRDFARFAGTPTAALAVDHLLALTGGAANGLVLEYRTALDDRGLSTATIARRLAALLSMTRMARMLGRIGWVLEIRAPQGRRRRVVLGPDQVAWKRLWSAAVKAGAARLPGPGLDFPALRPRVAAGRSDRDGAGRRRS